MKRRGRTLTEEEQALWREVARTTARRRHAKPAARSTDAPDQPPRPEAPAPPETPSRSRFTEGLVLRPFGRTSPTITTPQPDALASSGLDRRTEQRLRKGKREPDARLDLHGMTAQRAHAALIRFIDESRRAGRRMVLVITGKGAVGAPRDFMDAKPGVLRREAPVWLSTPPLSGMIVNVSQAHPRHGGGGALYVYLKKVR